MVCRSERKPTVLCWRWNIFVLEDLWKVRTKCSAFFLFNPRKGHIAGFHIPREGQNLPLVWVIRFSLESARQLLDNSTGLDPERKPCLLKWSFEYHELFSWFQVSPWELRGDKLNHVVASTAWTNYRTPWVHGPIPCFIQVCVCVLFWSGPLTFHYKSGRTPLWFSSALVWICYPLSASLPCKPSSPIFTEIPEVAPQFGRSNVVYVRALHGRCGLIKAGIVL